MGVEVVGTALYVRVGVAVVVLVGTAILARLLRRAVARFLKTRRLAESDPGAITRFKMIARLGVTTLWFVGVGLALYVVNVSVFKQVAVGMFASAGVMGIALGFASQTTAANLVSGVIIAFAQPLRLGDRVEVDLEQGIVEEIGLLYTTIHTWDNRRVLIPNQFLSTRVIRNSTVTDPKTPAAVTFTLKHGTDLGGARSLLLDEARSQPLFVADPHPSVEVVSADETGVVVRLVAWAADRARANELTSALREHGVGRLADAGMLVGSATAGAAAGSPTVGQGAAVSPAPAGVSMSSDRKQ